MESKTLKKVLIWGMMIIWSLLLLVDDTMMSGISIEDERGFLVQHAGDTRETVFSECFVLDPGTYHIKLGYTSSEPNNTFEVVNYRVGVDELYFEQGEGIFEYTLELDKPTIQLEIMANYCGKGYLEIKNFYIEPEQPWYYDSWLRVVGLWLMWIMVVLSNRYMKKEEGNRNRAIVMDIWIVIGIAILASVPFFNSYSVCGGDDSGYHLTRIEGIANGIRMGQIPVIVFPEFVEQNGYLNAMYPSLFLYIPALLRLLGVSLLTSYKVLFIIINFATSFSMYVSMKCMTSSRKAVILATTMYVFMRYRFNNMLIRGALGETLAMVFFPLVIAGLYQIIVGERKKWWILVIGATGVIQSHILSVMIYVTIAVIVVVVCMKKIVTEVRFIELGKATICTILLNAWFVVPFLIFFFEGNINTTALLKYASENSLSVSYIVGIFEVFGELNMKDFSLRLPVICMLGICLGYLLMNGNIQNVEKKLLTTLVILAIGFIYLASNWFPMERICEIQIFESIFSNLQFAWRLLGPTAGIVIMVGAIWLVQWKDIEKYAGIICVMLCILVIFDISTWELKRYHDVADAYSTPVDEEMILKRKICRDVASFPSEYFIGESHSFDADYRVSHDGISVEKYEKDGLSIDLTYQIDAKISEKTTIQLPLLHYIGYRASDENGIELELNTGENGTIVVDLLADGNEHSVFVRYKHPIEFRIAELVSLITLIGICCISFIKRNKNKLML